MLKRRLEIALPPKGSPHPWGTYPLTADHLLAAIRALDGAQLTPREKRLARNFRETLARARTHYLFAAATQEPR